MASKNQGRLNRGYMGHHEGDVLNTLPRYNYATGSGFKTGSCKGGSRKLDFRIRRKIANKQYTRIG